MKRTIVSAIILTVLAVGVSGCNKSARPSRDTRLPAAPGHKNAKLPRPDHVVVVVDENHAYEGIIGVAHDPYINTLVKRSAVFTASYAVTHPSQPNYLALFSGSTHSVRNDSCPHTFVAPNLASELIAHHLSFGGYAQSLPKVGFKGCRAGDYWRKHCPWVNFTNVPESCHMPWSSFPADFNKLPTVSFIIPNNKNNMHDRSSQFGDAWLQTHINPYIEWANNNNSLLIITWDEDDDKHDNHIPTLFVGPMVRAGRYSERIDHYDVLRSIEDMYALPHLGKTKASTPITSIWK